MGHSQEGEGKRGYLRVGGQLDCALKVGRFMIA